MRLSLLITNSSYHGSARECVFDDASGHADGESRGLVGRDPATCRMLIEEGSVSRRHFEVLFSQGAFWIQNLSETNGTQIVGKKLLSRKNERIQIEHDDRILVGDTELRASILPDEADTPPASSVIADEPARVEPRELPPPSVDFKIIQPRPPLSQPLAPAHGAIIESTEPPFPALTLAEPPSLPALDPLEPPPLPALQPDEHATTSSDHRPHTTSETHTQKTNPGLDPSPAPGADEPTDKHLTQHPCEDIEDLIDATSDTSIEAPSVTEVVTDLDPQSGFIEINDINPTAPDSARLIPEDLDLEALLGIASPAPKAPAKVNQAARPAPKETKGPTPANPAPAKAHPPKGQSPANASTPGDLTAILVAAGLEPERAHALAETVRAEHVGVLLSALVDALASQLQTRNSFKHMFRLSSTEVRLAGNNPLKLATTGQDILSRLFDPQRGFLGGVDAVREATLDLQIHEAAIASSIRTAFDDLIDRIDPAHIEEATAKAGSPLLGGFGGGRDAASWKAYRQWFDHTFGDRHRAFTTIYLQRFGNDYDTNTKKAKSESDKKRPRKKEGRSKT
jgi:type VI secretion system FHA domain protein